MSDTLTLPTMPQLKPTQLLPSVQLIEWQLAAVDDIVERLTTKDYRGIVLRGGTGLGKMYIKALAIRKLSDNGQLTLPKGSVTPFPVLWLCPKSVKIQTKRVLQECGIAHLVLVVSYGELKSKFGTDMWLSWVTVMKLGNPHLKPIWLPMFLPSVVVCDEIQKLKNDTAQITDVLCECPSDVKWIGASATPWQRVSDARCTLLRCGAVMQGYNVLPPTYDTVNRVLDDIAYPKNRYEYSPSAVGRLRDALDPYIVELKNVRFKFQTKTVFKFVPFKSPEQSQQYANAHREYIAAMAKQGKHAGTGILVAIAKFKEKAEFLRYEQLAENAFAAASQGRQVLIGVNYLNTARGIWTHLTKQLLVPAARIAFIVGGQTEKARQDQVDKFQRGECDYIIVTTTSGGVGISLHHDRASTKPRHVVIPLPWSAIDLVQFLGRGHRLTSLSATTQEAIAIAGTIEETKVVPKLQIKVKCLSRSVTAKEQFCTLFEPDDVDAETVDNISEVIETARHEGESDNNIDEVESEVTGEGLDSVDDLPTTYK